MAGAARALVTVNVAFREFVEAGGLMSYGSNKAHLFRMAADQVARIFEDVAQHRNGPAARWNVVAGIRPRPRNEAHGVS